MVFARHLADLIQPLQSTRPFPLLPHPAIEDATFTGTRPSMFQVSLPLSASHRCQFLVQRPIAAVPLRWTKIVIAAPALRLMPCVAAPCGSIQTDPGGGRARPAAPAAREPLSTGRIEAASVCRVSAVGT
jgi:hypothetical protein